MKTLILFHSEHHGNTEKVAKVIGDILDAVTVRSVDVALQDLKEYDLVGFGSGVYYSKYHDSLYRAVEGFPTQQETKAFLFSTTGSKTYSMRAHEAFKSLLAGKGFSVVAEFSCLGFDTALSSEGINKGKPDAADLKDAEKFAKGLAE